MSKRQSWEQRFAGEDYLFGTEPIEFLAQQAARLAPGMRALAIADGEGRNGVWLAERGLDVVSIDISENALAKAQRLAAERGVSIETLRVDVNEWDWPTAAFDLVVTVYFHPPSEDRKRLHAAIFEALRPGGLIILEAFSKQQIRYRSGGPDDPDRLYSADSLRREFAAANILLLEEKTLRRRTGRFPGKLAAVIRLIADNP